MFKIETGYYLEFLTPGTMKLLESTKSKITKDKNGETFPDNYQQNSRALYTFIPNKSFRRLLDISPENLIILETFDSEVLYIEVSFTDENSNLFEIVN